MGKLRDQANRWVGRIIIGGAIATGLVGGGQRIMDFDDAGVVIPSKTVIIDDKLNAALTGSWINDNTDIVRIDNPLAFLSGGTVNNAGSGIVMELWYHNIANPAAVALDICYSKTLNTGTGSSGCFFEDTNTATGKTMYWALSDNSGATLGTPAFWNGADSIVANSGVDPTSAFDARIHVRYKDAPGI